MDIPKNWPHTCGSNTTWIDEGKKYKVICSFCRKTMGYWTYTSATEEKAYPQKKDSKFSTTNKQHWK